MEESETSQPGDGKERQKRKGGEVAGRFKRARATVDDAFLESVVQFVKKSRPKALTKEEKLDILLLQAYLRNEHAKKDRNGVPGKRQPAPQVSKTVAKILRRKQQLVKQVWSEYVQHSSVAVSEVPCNRSSRTQLSRVPNTRLVTSKVHQFVRDRRKLQTRTVAKDVAEFLLKNDFISYDQANSKELSSALRSVQRFLKRKGFRKEKRKEFYSLKPELAFKRDSFVQRLILENSSKARRVVYIGESYFHKDYCRQEDSRYDPNDEQDLAIANNQKGQWYGVMGAIVTEDSSVPESERSEEQRAGLLMDSIDIFEGGKKHPHDHQGLLDSKQFIEWMKKLVALLERRGIKNALLVMDESVYHKVIPAGIPRKAWLKTRMIDYCKRSNIELPPHALKSSIWATISQHVKMNGLAKPVVTTIAAESGHDVLFAPLCLSEVLPVEFLWGYLKGLVGKEHSPEQSYKDFLGRIKTAISELQPAMIGTFITNSNLLLEKLHLELKLVDDLEDQDGDDAENENIPDEEDESDEESSDDSEIEEEET